MSGKGLLDTEVRYLTETGEDVTTTVGTMDLDRASRSEPIRRIRSHRGQRHYSGLYWSFRTRTHVAYESRLELERLLLADVDPATMWLAAQPFSSEGPTLTARSDMCRTSASYGVPIACSSST
ncbi:hypothetical protein [Agrococcus sp. KRD186]|uniref:hypothetical protein n=1 Tax=Agrococcus sp. KRD186 TaxID=2729730 RepID=UPI0019CF6FD2|nr:hypothetical protein [Agrococcus sp. KRD186]